MKRIFMYLSRTKKEAILAPLFKMLEVVFELLVPVIVSLIINKGINEGGQSDLKFIFLMCGILFAFGILGLLSSVTAQYFAAVASSKLQSALRTDLLKKINSLEYKELDDVGTASLITRMSSDVNQVTTGVNMALRLLLRSPIVIIGAVIVAFFFSNLAGITFLITVPVLFLLIFLVMVFTIPLFKKSQQKLDVVVRLSRENLNGVRVIRAFNKQEAEIEKFNKTNDKLAKYQLFVGKISNIINPLTFALINFFIIALIYVGALQVDVGSLENGDVVALYNLASQILVEMVKFATLLVTMSKSLASNKRIEQIFSIKSNLKHLDVIDKINTDDLFVFDNVSMSYNGQEMALNNISFKVKKGQMIGIIGGTGSGKTTLVNLIPHFYDISEGKIYYKGLNLLNYDEKTLRFEIAVVPQKSQLFKGTIRDNLKLGNLAADDETLYNALKISQGYDFVMAKDGGLSYPVEQEGRNFSGGQKQRLTIARALVKQSDILILDDSSSALDFKTESELRKGLKKLNKTIFIVSQRTASLRACDQIIVLDKGHMAGLGTHEELLKSSQIYREIYFSQYKEEKDETL